jgi:hypothetical protein
MSDEDYWTSEPDTGRLFYANPEYAKDSAKALKELNALVDQGSVMSMVYLAYAHWRWIGTKKDLTPSCGG